MALPLFLCNTECHSEEQCDEESRGNDMVKALSRRVLGRLGKTTNKAKGKPARATETVFSYNILTNANRYVKI